MFLRPTLDSPGSRFVRFFREGEWYFSWGFSKQYWAPTDIHVSQPSQGNDFTIHNVQGHDDPGFSGLLHGSLFGAQYNLRIGRFVNDAHTVAVELSLDHSKYHVADGQTANVTGTIHGTQVNGSYVLDANFFRYMLNNGANHLMLNLAVRQPLIGKTNETYSLAGIGKIGAGIMVPHTENTIMGQSNDVGVKMLSNLVGFNHGWWQFGGWTTGVEAGLRFVVYKPWYIELTDKVAYASLWNLPAYQGTVSHSLLMNEIVLSVGYTFDGSPHH